MSGQQDVTEVARALAAATGNFDAVVQRRAEELAAELVAAARREVDDARRVMEGMVEDARVSTERLRSVLVELRRQFRSPLRASEAWSKLLRECNDYDRDHWQVEGNVGTYALIPTSLVRSTYADTKPDDAMGQAAWDAAHQRADPDVDVFTINGVPVSGRAFAQVRQALASSGLWPVPAWEQLSEHEQNMAALDARNWLRALTELVEAATPDTEKA